METQSRKAHPLLRRALEEIYRLRGAEGRPPPPYHLGPPTPQVSARDALWVAHWLVEEAIRETPREGPACVTLLAAIRGALESRPEIIRNEDPRYTRIREVARAGRRASAMGLLSSAVEGLNALASNNQASVLATVETMVALHVQELADRTAAAFVRRLDDEIIRLECQHVVRMLEPKPPAPMRILWRWAPETASRAEQWIVRTKVGHAWIAAAPRSIPGKGKRAFFEGTLDDALSCVPDTLFAAAADVALRRDASM